MPRIYDTLSPETRARFPLDSLDAESQQLLARPIPAKWSPRKAATISALIDQGMPKVAARAVRTKAVAEGRIRMTPEGRIAPPASPKAGLVERFVDRTVRAFPDLGFRSADETLDAISPGSPNQGEAFASIYARARRGEGIPENPRVGPASNIAERSVDVAGGITGFAGTAATLAPILGPLALGAAAAAPAGTPKERVVRGGVAQVAGAAGHAAGSAIGGVIPGIAGRAAATVPSALAFGSAAPVAESAIMRADIPGIGLHGDSEYPMPTVDDIIQGGGELAVANLILGGRGIVRGGRAKAAPLPVESPEILSLPAGRIPPGRRLPASTSGAEVIEAGPGASPIPATEAPVSRQLAPGPAASGPTIELPRRLDRGAWITSRFPGALEKLAPELAADSRLVGGGNTVADLFRAAVAKRLGGVEPQAATRADVKAAVRAVLASGEMRGFADIADAVNEPRGVRVPNEVRQREARFSQELTRRAAGREVLIDTPSGTARAVVVSVNAFRYPGVADPVRAVVADPGTGQIRVLRYGSLPDMTAALNSPQALRKAEDVFARSERQRDVRAARSAQPEKPVAGTSPVAPAPREAEPPRAPAAAPAKPAQGKAARGAMDLFGLRQESTPKPAAEAKPEAPKGAEKPAPQARVESPAVAAAPPAAPSEAPARPRVVIDLPVRDAKSAERLVAGINKSNPDIEARIEQRGGRVVITGNADAKEVERPKRAEPPRPKGEPAATPAPESPAGGSGGDRGGTAEATGQTPRPAGKPAKGRAEFKEGEGVSVPNLGRGSKGRVRGKAIGYLEDSSGKRTLQVAVPRGRKGNVAIEEHNPDNVLRLPKKGGNEEARAKKAATPEAVRAKMAERAGGSMLRASQITHEAIHLHGEHLSSANALPHPTEFAGDDAIAAKRERDRAMRKLSALANQQHAAASAEHRLAVEHFGDEYSMRARSLPEYADAWIEAKGKHKGLDDTPENHDAYFRAVEESHVGSTREASELLRYAAERAGGKIREALPAVRGIRYLEQQRAFEEQAKSEGIPDILADDASTSADIRKALDTLPPAEAAKEIDRILGEYGPGDDIPAGTIPNVPEGFAQAARSLGGESGKVNIDMLLPHVWIREIRNIARAAAAQRRAVPARERTVQIVDANGNVVGRHEHGILDPDPWSHSKLTRFLASFARMEPGAHVLTPEMQTHYKLAQSDQARFDGLWNMRWAERLGDAARFIAPHSNASKMIADAMEGSLPISKLPKHLQHAPEVIRGIYRDMLVEVNDRRKSLGMPPIEGIEKYQPHIVLGRVADAVGQDLRRVWTDKHATEADINEMKSRFLFEREGDPEYVRDAAFQFVEYTNAIGRYLAHLEFWQTAERQLADMEAGLVDRGPERRAATVLWMQSAMMRKKGFAERWMDKAGRLVMFANGSADLREISESAAARVPGVDMEALKKEGWSRAFMAGPNTKFRVGLGKESFEAGRNAEGERLILTKGHNLFVMDPQIRPWIEKSARKRARASVEKDAALERAARKMGSKPGEFLNDAFAPWEHAKMREDAWRAKVLRGQYSLFDAVFRGMGNMQSRALLGYNLRSILSNSLQMYLTMAPEIGYWRTTKAVGKMLSRPSAHLIANILEKRGAITPEHANKIRQGFPIGRRTAQMVGALQGEVQRTHELTSDERSAVKMVYDALGPMAGFKAAEDFTRGVGILGASYLADRMGYSPEVASRFANENTPGFYEEWGERIAAARKPGSREHLYARMDSEWMFDYNALGQSPIFGGPIGGLFGRMMTFTGRYTRKFVTAPVGGVAKVGTAMARGLADRSTGGVLSGILKPKRRGRTYGRYPAPASEFSKWLDEYGALHQDRQAAKVFFRQVQGLGMLAGISAATGLSTALIGSPGWQQLPLLLLMSMLPQGSPEKKKVAEIMQDFRRSAIGDPGRGVEGTMSPVMANLYRGVEEIPRARRRAELAAKKGDTWGVVKESATPLFVAMRAQGETSAIPGLVAIRRLFQEMPHAEGFFESPAGRAFAHLAGIKSYIRGNGVVESIKGNLGLRPVVEQERNRVQIDRKRSSGRPQRPSSGRRPSRALSFLEQRPQGGVA